MQDRRACCGTMNNAQYFDLEDVLEAERQALAHWCQGYAARHQHRDPATAPAAGGDELAVNK
jgi:hypothetical protein